MGERGRVKIMAEWNYEMAIRPVFERISGNLPLTPMFDKLSYMSNALRWFPPETPGKARLARRHARFLP